MLSTINILGVTYTLVESLGDFGIYLSDFHLQRKSSHPYAVERLDGKYSCGLFESLEEAQDKLRSKL